jgi:outer membrane protein
MRNLLKSFAVVFILASATTVNAQQKFGHIDLQALVQVMPERAAAETAFNKFQAELEDLLTGMSKEYQTKLGELETLQKDTTVSELKRNAKISELQDLQQRMDNFRAKAQTDLQSKQAELLNPVFQKAEKAIEDVAKENTLLYVFDTSSKVVLYKSNQSIDILPLAKAKLGIK